MKYGGVDKLEVSSSKFKSWLPEVEDALDYKQGKAVP